MGSGALLQRSFLLQQQGSRAAVPSRHELRLLPRGSESGKAAGRSGPSEMGKPELECRRAVFLDRPDFLLADRIGPAGLKPVGPRPQFRVSALPYFAPRLARYIVRLD